MHKTRAFRMRTMSCMEELSRSPESASSGINHSFVKSCISSVSRNLCVILTPKSEIRRGIGILLGGGS